MAQSFKNAFAAALEEAAKKKLDPVGQADADIDNDGDVDSSDEYLHNRRKAIKKSMKNEEAELDEGIAGAAMGALGGYLGGKAVQNAAGVAAGGLARKAGASIAKAADIGLKTRKLAPKIGAGIGAVAGHQATKKNEIKEAEIDEAAPKAPKIDKGKAKGSISATGLRGKGMKKFDVNVAVNKNGKFEFRITDEQGKFQTVNIKKAASMLGESLEDLDSLADLREEHGVEVFEAAEAMLEEQGISFEDLSEEEIVEFIGAIARGIKRQTIDRVTTSGRTARLNRQADKDEKKTAKVNAYNAAKNRARDAKAAKKKVTGPSTGDKVRSAASAAKKKIMQ